MTWLDALRIVDLLFVPVNAVFGALAMTRGDVYGMVLAASAMTFCAWASAPP